MTPPKIISLAIILFFMVGCAATPPPAENRARLGFQSELSVEADNMEPFVSEQARHAFWRCCSSCHGPDGRGINAIGPDLRQARRRTSEEWERYLRDGSGAHPAGQPPPLWMTGDELTAVARYVDFLSRTGN
jgi:mono/diheme cytochrome c family protein